MSGGLLYILEAVTSGLGNVLCCLSYTQISDLYENVRGMIMSLLMKLKLVVQGTVRKGV